MDYSKVIEAEKKVELLKHRAATGDGVMPFSWYQENALRVTDDACPTNPAFGYWVHTWAPRIQGNCRAFLWFSFLIVTFPVLIWLKTVVSHWIFAFTLADFCFIMFTFILAPWPEKEHGHENDPDYLKKIGVLLPCHKSADEIGSTVTGLLRYLEPQNIVVVDNGNSTMPLDNTRHVLEEIDPRIRYIWIPIGNKTNALWIGLQEMPKEVEYIMHIDDDTDVPEDFVFDEKIWEDPRVSSTSYAIEMKRTGLVESVVDWEFRMISVLRCFEGKWSSVWFAHGIIGLWRRSAFEDVMKENPQMFHGEDGWNGITNLMMGRRMLQEARSSVSTYAPSRVLPGCGGEREQGYGAANIWKQRAYRWNVTPPRRVWLRLYLLLFYKGDTLMDNFAFRFLTLYHISCIFVALVFPFSMIMWLKEGMWWYILQIKGTMLVLNFLKACALNYWYFAHRPDLQTDFKVVCIMPFYMMFQGVCQIFGNWRTLIYYMPRDSLRYGLYTQGLLTANSLKKFHNIDSIDDVEYDGSTESTGEGD